MLRVDAGIGAASDIFPVLEKTSPKQFFSKGRSRPWVGPSSVRSRVAEPVLGSLLHMSEGSHCSAIRLNAISWLYRLQQVLNYAPGMRRRYPPYSYTTYITAYRLILRHPQSRAEIQWRATLKAHIPAILTSLLANLRLAKLISSLESGVPFS